MRELLGDGSQGTTPRALLSNMRFCSEPHRPPRPAGKAGAGLVNVAMMPIMCFRHRHLRAREIGIDDAVRRAARC
jgi:hypothetical protein